MKITFLMEFFEKWQMVVVEVEEKEDLKNFHRPKNKNKMVVLTALTYQCPMCFQLKKSRKDK